METPSRTAVAPLSDSVVPLEYAVDARAVLRVLAQIKGGDFSARMPLEWTGVAGKVADGLNDVIIANQALEAELARVREVVGKQGKLSQRVVPGGLIQGWSGPVESVNSLIDDLVRPTIEMQRVIGAVADGDLSKKVSAEVHGEMRELKNTINAMVDQLNGFISEVTRVTREVGTEGKLGQAAAVTIEVGGVWKELTDNVNLMAGNLTGQVRNIAEVTTAVANGDLSKKISIDVKGEFLELKNTVNAMVDQLNRFAGEVTRVAREVGVEGKLGGQAQSKEVGGVWKDLTDNVNGLAANLTNQVRAISEVATAVTEGDLTRQVSVEASGEVAILKDKLNEMIRNLRETTRQNVEQDWLKTHRERFTRMLQGQDDLSDVSTMILSELATLVSAQHGVFYTMADPATGGPPVLQFQAGYGYEERKHFPTSFRLGQGLIGQCAKEKKRILLTDVPSDYVRINSGLGEATPLNIIVLPVLFEGSVRAVVELASFSPFSITHQAFLDSITESIGIVLGTIQAAVGTETLLKESQSLAEELRSQQQKLILALNLAQTRGNEVRANENLISNVSHELLTPLAAIHQFASILLDKLHGDLTEDQLSYLQIVVRNTDQLTRMVHDLVDSAKVQDGKLALTPERVRVTDVVSAALEGFTRRAEIAGVHLDVGIPDDLPDLRTDPSRFEQVVSNLLDNALKFTPKEGTVSVEAGRVAHDDGLVWVAVSDTGPGIPAPDLEQLFDRLYQGQTGGGSRKGLGLGLFISKGIMERQGGSLDAGASESGGARFTLTLPAWSEAGPQEAATPVKGEANDKESD